MKGLLAVVAIIAAIIAAICVWACGLGFVVSLVALVLKWCGVGFLAGMSSWLPLQLIGGWIVSAVVMSGSAAVAFNLIVRTQVSLGQ